MFFLFEDEVSDLVAACTCSEGVMSWMLVWGWAMKQNEELKRKYLNFGRI